MYQGSKHAGLTCFLFGTLEYDLFNDLRHETLHKSHKVLFFFREPKSSGQVKNGATIADHDAVCKRKSLILDLSTFECATRSNKSKVVRTDELNKKKNSKIQN